jgi:hypothetical protein
MPDVAAPDLIHPQDTHPLLARQSAALSTDNGTLATTTKLFVRLVPTTDATISSHQEENPACDGGTRSCLGRRLYSDANLTNGTNGSSVGGNSRPSFMFRDAQANGTSLSLKQLCSPAPNPLRLDQLEAIYVGRVGVLGGQTPTRRSQNASTLRAMQPRGLADRRSGFFSGG